MSLKRFYLEMFFKINITVIAGLLVGSVVALFNDAELSDMLIFYIISILTANVGLLVAIMITARKE